MTLAALSLGSFLLGMRPWQEIVAAAGLIGLWVLFVVFRDKWRVYRSRGWPTSPGIVGNIRSQRVSTGKEGDVYWKLTFDYTYKVQREHTNSYSVICATENMANRASAGLKGKTVSVHYKPSDENKAVLWEDEVRNIW